LKVGLFFGSFNPIHIGHLIIANIIYEYTDLREIWFVVSPQNPHKRDSHSLIHEFDRIDMVELAIEDRSGFKTTDIEFHMDKPNYTIHTLTYLKEKNPQHEFFLIIGEDNLSSFRKWKNHEIILEDYGLIVYPRPGSKQSDIMNHKNVQIVNAPKMDISASFIRKCIRENKSVRYLVPDKVFQFIQDRKLYR
jgi:nicotinate-nucleotide adenylyltransferase